MKKQNLFFFLIGILLLNPIVSLSTLTLLYSNAGSQEQNSNSFKEAISDPEKSLARLPLYFIANEGQTDNPVSFYIQGRDKTIFFSPHDVSFSLTAPLEHNKETPEETPIESLKSSKHTHELSFQRWAVKLAFVDANPNVTPFGELPTQAVVSYFKGDLNQWTTGIPTYHQIRYPNLWPGIDLVYSGIGGTLKYEFIVQPGADPNKIQLAYQGASDVRVSHMGQLEISTPVGNFFDAEPFAYQERDGQRLPVEMAYKISIEERTGIQDIWQVKFALGNYDPSLTLILDPEVLMYSGYIGGSERDVGNGIALDNDGNIYITGETHSHTTFPVYAGPDLSFNGPEYGSDAFIVKVSEDGKRLIYAGYIGGSEPDSGNSIAVDNSGNAYITGTTTSSHSSFPVMVGPDLTYNGQGDAFVVKVNPSGTALVYSGYIGGEDIDNGNSIAVDGSGHAYIAGGTKSTESSFPVFGGPDLTHNGHYDSFIAKVNPAGTTLAYAGYIGGGETDYGNSIAVDSDGNAYLAGSTSSHHSGFPVTVGPDLTFNGEIDGFIAKVNADGSSLIYAGYIGGNSIDVIWSIAIDAGGNAFVTGHTVSTEATFPVLVGPDLTFNGGLYTPDAFVAKVNPSGTGLVYAGYIGGSGTDFGSSIAVDHSGNAYIAGRTQSDQTSFPVLVGPDLTHNGGSDAFVTKVNPTGSALVYAGYIGGHNYEEATAIAVDQHGNAYITGLTSSSEVTFPILAGPDLSYNGGDDVFLAKVGASGSGPIDLGVNRIEILQSLTVKDANEVLISGKPTVLRAYVSLHGAASLEGVSGKLTRYINGAAQDTLISGPITVPFRSEEAEYSSSLNFYLPSDWLVPGTEYVVEIDPDNIIPETNENNNRFPAAGSQKMNFVTTPVLEIVIVPVTYARPGFPVTTPPTDDLTYLTSFFEEVFPVGNVVYSIRDIPFTFTGNLFYYEGWRDLLSDLTTIHEYEDPHQNKIYYGLVDGGGGDVAGIAWLNNPNSNKPKKTAAGSTGSYPHMGGQIFAHELGHIHGLFHTATYIDRWGYDSRNDALLAPYEHIDNMNGTMYNISKYWTNSQTFTNIYHSFSWMNNWKIDWPYSLYLPTAIRGFLPALSTGQIKASSIQLNGVITPGGQLEIEPVFTSLGVHIPSDKISQYHAVLLDNIGRQLVSHPLDLIPVAFDDGSEDYIGYAFRETLPLFEGFAGFQIFKDNELIYERYKSLTSNLLESVKQEIDSRDNLQVTWTSRHSSSDLSYRVLYSPDGGSTWLVLSPNSTIPKVQIPTELINQALHPILLIQASDGVQTDEQMYELPTAKSIIDNNTYTSVNYTMDNSTPTNIDTTYKLTVELTGSGNGTVTSSPAGINCGMECSNMFDLGVVVTLTATPGLGNAFRGWSGPCIGTGVCKIYMGEDQLVSAVFEPANPTLRVVKLNLSNGSGTVTSNPPGINCGADCIATFDFSTWVTLTATPSQGSTFYGWGGNCAGTTTPCPILIEDYLEVHAVFTKEALMEIFLPFLLR
jgi:hypothetical protein